MNRFLAPVLIVAMSLASVGATAADKPQTIEGRRALQKLMDAYGAGEMSAKTYKIRKGIVMKADATAVAAK